MFGVRGEVRLMLHHREGSTLFTERTVTLVSADGERRDVRLRARSGAGKRVLARISGVDTPEQAAALMGWAIVVDRATLPAPAEGEYYIHDLLELPVFDAQGAALGTLADVVNSPQHDIWVVEGARGESFVLATPENVVSVDVPGRRIVMQSHNHLLKSVPGCDGFKTGFISAAGYSIVATAQRNGQRVIVVVLDSLDRKVRDARAADLIEKAFAALAAAPTAPAPAPAPPAASRR